MKFRQRLPGDAAAGDLLTNGIRNLPALLGGKLLVRHWHRHLWLNDASLADAQSITNPHKTVPAVAERGGARPNNADHSARAKSPDSARFQAAKTPFGVSDMTTCDEIEAGKRSEYPSLIGLVLFFVMQGVAVILVGFAALFLSFEPVWSAERPSAAFLKPGDARSGSLLLKTEEGYADASRLGVDVDLTVSGPTVRARGS